MRKFLVKSKIISTFLVMINLMIFVYFIMRLARINISESINYLSTFLDYIRR